MICVDIFKRFLENLHSTGGRRMEKLRIVWHSPRSMLGLIVLGVTSFYPLNSKEIFDSCSRHPSSGFDYGSVKTVSFFFLGKVDMDFGAMVKSMAKGNANIVICEKSDPVIGESLSPTISISVIVRKDIEGKNWLVTINAGVKGEATEIVGTYEGPYVGKIPILESILVFVDPQPKEIESSISAHMENLIDKIISAAKVKPKFFVQHSSLPITGKSG